LIVVNIENRREACKELHTPTPGDAPVWAAVVAPLTSRLADRRCRRIDSRCSLLNAAIVLVKARYEFTDVPLIPALATPTNAA
jgi:hypothetical protein